MHLRKKKIQEAIKINFCCQIATIKNKHFLLLHNLYIYNIDIIQNNILYVKAFTSQTKLVDSKLEKWRNGFDAYALKLIFHSVINWQKHVHWK